MDCAKFLNLGSVAKLDGLSLRSDVRFLERKKSDVSLMLTPEEAFQAGILTPSNFMTRNGHVDHCNFCACSTAHSVFNEFVPLQADEQEAPRVHCQWMTERQVLGK